MTATFAKAERLRGAEFDTVFKKGRRFKSDLFLFLYYHTETSPNKLGLITAKKKIKTAVKRNLARRIVKEQFRLAKDQLQYYHIVAIAHALPKAPQRADTKARSYEASVHDKPNNKEAPSLQGSDSDRCNPSIASSQRDANNTSIEIKNDIKSRYHQCCEDFFSYLAKRSKRSAKA